MLSKLGLLGVLGLALTLAGILVIALQDLYIAAGVAFVVAGLGLTIAGLLKSLLSSLGMGGLV
jgi:hypothetical protein